MDLRRDPSEQEVSVSFFLFLRVLRCFTSPRSLRRPMYSVDGHRCFIDGVSPFGHSRITGCLPPPRDYRRLRRPSSAHFCQAIHRTPLRASAIQTHDPTFAFGALRRQNLRSSLDVRSRTRRCGTRFFLALYPNTDIDRDFADGSFFKVYLCLQLLI